MWCYSSLIFTELLEFQQIRSGSQSKTTSYQTTFKSLNPSLVYSFLVIMSNVTQVRIMCQWRRECQSWKGRGASICLCTMLNKVVGKIHVGNIQLPFIKEYKGPASQALTAIAVATPPTSALNLAVSCLDYVKTKLPFWFYYNSTGLPLAKLSQLLRTPLVAPFFPYGDIKIYIWWLEVGLLFILNVVWDYLVDSKHKIASCHS